MPPENKNPSVVKNIVTPLTTVTPLSKYLAMILFVTVPIVTLYVGYTFAPTEYVEVEKIVYRDTPSSNTETGLNYEKVTPLNNPANNVTLKAEEYINANGSPESKIFVGNTMALTAAGSCNFKQYEQTGDLFISRQMLKDFISDEIKVVESGICWFGGGGSEFYTVNDKDSVRLVGMEIYECGNLPKSECTGFGEPEILFEMDTAGVVTKHYSSGLFGG